MDIDHQRIWSAIDRIVASDRFANSESLVRILKYIVTEELAGRGEGIKAYTIATSALGRPETFDPQLDPSVRVAMGRMRAQLSMYYAGKGQDEEILLTIPKGSYRPHFETNPAYQTPGESSDTILASHEELPPMQDTPESLLQASSQVRYVPLNWWVFGILVATLVAMVSGVVVHFLFHDHDQSGGSSLTASAITLRLEPSIGPAQDIYEIDQSIAVVDELRSKLSRNDAFVVIVQPEQSPLATESLDETSDDSEPEPSAQIPELANIDFRVNVTIRRIGGDDRMSVTLVNARTNAIVWSRSFAFQVALQGEASELLHRVARDLHSQIFGASKQALEGRDPKTLSPWQLFIKATWVPGPDRNSFEWEKERLELARMAISLKPDFGPAYSVLADKLAYHANIDSASNNAEALKEARQSAVLAMQLSPNDPNVLFNVSRSQWHMGLHASARNSLKRVLEIDPNHALAGALVNVVPYTCAPASNLILEGAVDYDASLDPNSPIRWFTISWLGLLHMNRGDLGRALEMEERAAKIFEAPYSFMRRAAILNALGRGKEAGRILENQKDNWPDIDPDHFAEVTMPRLCRDERGPHKDRIIGYYQDLAKYAGSRKVANHHEENGNTDTR